MNGLINTKCSKCGEELTHRSYMFKGKRQCECPNCGLYEEEGSPEEKRQYWKHMNEQFLQNAQDRHRKILDNINSAQPKVCRHCGSMLISYCFPGGYDYSPTYFCIECETTYRD